ncbi:STAS domain-containing protein [Streptomyces sp. NPDC102394]|uniref:STAS domain-containing protein n=1 Tax=Streptomyces sp. NPDC102394 TaxID=3366167 RepID=UPI0037F29EF4
MRQGKTTVARLPEAVDYDTASHLGAECRSLIELGCRTLVLDASQVQYLDSSGISMLLMVTRALEEHDGALRIAELSDHYQQVWHVLGLDTMFPIASTVNAALGSPTTEPSVDTRLDTSSM